MPQASPELLGRLVERRADFASTCCPPNSPPLYCASKVKPWRSPPQLLSTVSAASLRTRGCPFGSFPSFAGELGAGRSVRWGLLLAGISARR